MRLDERHAATVAHQVERAYEKQCGSVDVGRECATQRVGHPTCLAHTRGRTGQLALKRRVADHCIEVRDTPDVGTGQHVGAHDAFVRVIVGRAGPQRERLRAHPCRERIDVGAVQRARGRGARPPARLEERRNGEQEHAAATCRITRPERRIDFAVPERERRQPRRDIDRGEVRATNVPRPRVQQPLVDLAEQQRGAQPGVTLARPVNEGEPCAVGVNAAFESERHGWRRHAVGVNAAFVPERHGWRRHARLREQRRGKRDHDTRRVTGSDGHRVCDYRIGGSPRGSGSGSRSRTDQMVGSHAARSVSRRSFENNSTSGWSMPTRFRSRLISSSWSHSTSVTTMPLSPARAVRPERWR